MKLSLVELAVVAPGSDKPQALKDAVDAARHAENLGHHRVWYAEHHDTAGFAAQAPEILIALAARTTGRIRVGSLALPGQKGAEALPLGARRVTAVVRARWLTMGQPHPRCRRSSWAYACAAPAGCGRARPRQCRRGLRSGPGAVESSSGR